MSRNTFFHRTVPAAGAAVAVAVLLSIAAASTAQAATSLSGPIDLGTAAPFGVLGARTVTNTGPSVINGDLGVSPGTSITGFPPGSLTGTTHQTDATSTKAQADTTTAFNAAAGLTPTTSGLTELSGRSLTPGVYSGGALKLSNNGSLTLAGTAQSVWVFQAASTLTIGSGTRITLTGGASACNVFWKVGSSATLGSAAQFTGTVLAKQSITATTGARVVGRLLATTAAVTLDTNTITTPTGCMAGSAPVTTPGPAITSGAPSAATAGTPYHFTVTATGTPTPTYAVSAGTLPAGLRLNGTNGAISGTPTTPGSKPFTITASNGRGTPVSAEYTLAVGAAPATSPTTPSGAASPTPTTLAVVPTAKGGTGTEELAFTGSNPTMPLAGAASLLMVGLALILIGRRRRRLMPRRH